MSDLWGELPSPATIVSPEEILREQAELLTKKTKGSLIGDIVPASDDRSRRTYRYLDAVNFELAFNIRVPILNDFSYEICVANYQISLYPVFLSVQDESHPMECSSKDEFIKELGEVLRSERVRNVIGSLLKQVDTRLKSIAPKQGRRKDAPPESGNDDDIPF